MRGEGKVNPCTDLPLRADPIPCFVGAKHPETAEPVNQHISCRMLRPYAPTRTASVNAHRVGGQGQALPLRADRGILCRGNNMGRVGFRDW